MELRAQRGPFVFISVPLTPKEYYILFRKSIPCREGTDRRVRNLSNCGSSKVTSTILVASNNALVKNKRMESPAKRFRSKASSPAHPSPPSSRKLLCNPPNRPWETSKTKGGERWVVKEIPEWNRFTSNSTRIHALQPHLIMTSFVDPTSKDPQFWDFRNHPFAPLHHRYAVSRGMKSWLALSGRVGYTFRSCLTEK